MRKRWMAIPILAMALCAVMPAPAEDEKLTLAIFDFEAKDKDLAEMGVLLHDLTDAYLTVKDSVRLVTRKEMTKILEEQKLALSGLTEDAAPKVGKLLGAQVIVSGRIFAMGERLFVTAKVIGIETSRTYAEVVKNEMSEIDAIAMELADKIDATITTKGDTLVAKVVLEKDKLAEMKKKIGEKSLPRVFVHINERMVGQQTIDPAAQTEVSHILVKLGFEVVKDKSGGLKKWTEAFLRDGGKQAPPDSSKVDLVLVGEGFSEFAARTGDLISCKARVELEAIDIKSGKVMAADRETFTAVDLAEQIAGKTALQQAGGKLIYRMLPDTVDKWRKANGKELAKEPAKK